MTKPLCFVLMPFGRKPDADGRLIDFDAVYEEFIKPAIEAAELESIRADEEVVGGIIHKPMFERLLLCEFAVADLTTANANVFYELGVRHAVLPATTVLLFGGATHLPFDVALLRALPYQIDGSGKPLDPVSSAKALIGRCRIWFRNKQNAPITYSRSGSLSRPSSLAKSCCERISVPQ